jgi:hypothetical protein
VESASLGATLVEDDEDDVALTQALERSAREAREGRPGLSIGRTGTGTDDDELQEVLKLSLVDK